MKCIGIKREVKDICQKYGAVFSSPSITDSDKAEHIIGIDDERYIVTVEKRVGYCDVHGAVHRSPEIFGIFETKENAEEFAEKFPSSEYRVTIIDVEAYNE